MDDNWYYVSNDTEQVGPVSEGELNTLVACGQIRDSDLVWSESMADWAPYSSVTRLGAPSYSVSAAAPGLTGFPVPAGLAGWLQFVGVIHIIAGAGVCLIGLLSIITLIGPFIVVPFGILLIGAGTACTGAGTAVQRMNRVDSATLQFLANIKRYMIAYGILFVAHVAFALLGIIVLFIAAITGAEYAATY